MWHAAVGSEMGRDGATRAIAEQSAMATQPEPEASLVDFKRKTAPQGRAPPRRGHWDAEAHGQPYSRTDLVWKSRVDDWLYHGGLKTRKGHPDEMLLTTEDPFPLGSR